MDKSRKRKSRYSVEHNRNKHESEVAEVSQRAKKFKKRSPKNATQDGGVEASSKTQNALDNKELQKRYDLRRESLKRAMVAESTPVFRKLCDSFEMSRDPVKAAAMSKYLRFKFEFFGIQTPQRREISKPLWTEIKLMNSSDLRTLVCEAWCSPEREFQNFVTDLFEKEYLRIYADDGLTPENYATSTLDFARQFLASPKSWWDTVDPLAYKVVGPLVKKYPAYLLPIMDAWNVSEVTWLVRTSIIYQLGYGRDTDAERLFRYCLKAAHEEEFFIQKAIGWALRQHSREDPEAVKAFVQKHKKKLSALSVKEALKHIK